MWNKFRGYTALSERSFNYNSFRVFCYLLMAIAVSVGTPSYFVGSKHDKSFQWNDRQYVPRTLQQVHKFPEE